MRTTYFLSRETVIPTQRLGMTPWRESLFAFLHKNANSKPALLQLPANRVIELTLRSKSEATDRPRAPPDRPSQPVSVQAPAVG